MSIDTEEPNIQPVQIVDVTGTGTIVALNGAVSVTCAGCSTLVFNITGTWVATLAFQGTTDGTNWFTVYGNQISTDINVQNVTGNTVISVPCGGLFQARIIATAFTSGIASIAWNAGAGTLSLLVISPVATSFQTVANPVASNLSVTATAATGVALTASLGAVAGAFHYITFLEIVSYTTAARTGGATPVLVTSTNLNGSNAWDFQTAASIGTSERQFTAPGTPIKSSVVNTATTIVCPATTGIIWRVNVYYYTGNY